MRLAKGRIHLDPEAPCAPGTLGAPDPPGSPLRAAIARRAQRTTRGDRTCQALGSRAGAGLAYSKGRMKRTRTYTYLAVIRCACLSLLSRCRCVCVCVAVSFATSISSECRRVCGALVAIAGRRYTYTVYSYSGQLQKVHVTCFGPGISPQKFYCSRPHTIVFSSQGHR